MRAIPAAGLALMGAALSIGQSDGACAQGFGWLLGGSRGAGYVSPGRARRHHAMRPADAPLPPPRPDFAATPPRPASPITPIQNGDAARSTVPLPPERPGPTSAPAPTPTASVTVPAPPAAVPPPAPTPTLKADPSKGEAAKGEAAKGEAAKGEAAKGEPVRGDTTKSEAPAASPPVAASGATTAFDPRQPIDDADCPARLASRKVDAEPVAIGKQPDERCTVVRPMRLAGLTLRDGSRIEFPDRPTVACATADAFSAYVADLLSPLAKGSFGAQLTAVWTGPGLECRSRDHIFGAKLSAHGQGLAVDIAQLKLADGRTLAVGEPVTPVEQGFETAARAGGCGYFHTVLGPGSDSYHRTHWHFDLEVRGTHGDTKYCH